MIYDLRLAYFGQPNMTIHGQRLLGAFRTIHRNNSKQIGRYYCIPASISNALRLCGCNAFPQERIRDVFYQARNQAIPSDIDQQMTGCSFDIVDILKVEPSFSQTCIAHRFVCPGDSDPFNITKSQQAVDFITHHLMENHPVIVSTWMISWWLGTLQPQCCHMWLCLALDDVLQQITYHDPFTDQITQIPIRNSIALSINGVTKELEIGLRGRITHTDYCCLAFEPRQNP